MEKVDFQKEDFVKLLTDLMNRTRENKSMTEVADEMGISKARLSDALSVKVTSFPSYENFCKMAVYFKKKIKDFDCFDLFLHADNEIVSEKCDVEIQDGVPIMDWRWSVRCMIQLLYEEHLVLDSIELDDFFKDLKGVEMREIKRIHKDLFPAVWEYPISTKGKICRPSDKEVEEELIRLGKELKQEKALRNAEKKA